ncbi:hypothetical protein [Paramagnetospirillum marisnigri]|nr:hypothetical protein [Paramagnetospirillum marisnigri]
MAFDLACFRERFDRLMAAIRDSLAELDYAEAALRRQVADFTRQ